MEPMTVNFEAKIRVDFCAGDRNDATAYTVTMRGTQLPLVSNWVTPPDTSFTAQLTVAPELMIEMLNRLLNERCVDELSDFQYESL